MTLDVLFAAERLLPAEGGAERFAVELLESLAESHRVRALSLARERAHPASYWRAKRRRCAELEDAVAVELARDAADVVVTQLHAAPGAVRAAADAGVAAVLLLPSYEALCKYAFDAGSACGGPERCGRCPAALALSPGERLAHARARAEQAEAVALAAELVAPSEFVAAACEEWTGRRAQVVPPVARATTAGAPADPAGHVVVAAARWSANKGATLLLPLVEALPERRFAIAGDGLEPRCRDALAARPNVTVSPARPSAELLAGAALALAPSQWPEPFGRTAFEAMSAGVPCLASGRGGLGELVPPSERVDRAEDPAAWAAAVRGLRDERPWRAARARALERAAEILATRPLRRLERLLARAAAPLAQAR